MKVNFERVIIPCVVNDVISWHHEHGWCWDVVEVSTRRHVAVFFCTLLCGDGCVVHFETVPGIEIPWQTTVAAMKKGMRMVSGSGVHVIYATIPAEKQALIRAAVALGFRLTNGGFMRNDEPVELLKYFDPAKAILKT